MSPLSQDRAQCAKKRSTTHDRRTSLPRRESSRLTHKKRKRWCASQMSDLAEADKIMYNIHDGGKTLSIPESRLYRDFQSLTAAFQALPLPELPIAPLSASLPVFWGAHELALTSCPGHNEWNFYNACTIGQAAYRGHLPPSLKAVVML
ncbi:hypothetical protein Ancab_039475 [Ancistrocladus abbreviatus]